AARGHRPVQLLQAFAVPALDQQRGIAARQGDQPHRHQRLRKQGRHGMDPRRYAALDRRAAPPQRFAVTATGKAMAAGAGRRIALALALDAVLWYLAPAAFLCLYVTRFLAPPEAIGAHLRVVALPL